MKTGERRKPITQTCPVCEKDFKVYWCEIEKAERKGFRRVYCSGACQHSAYKGSGNPKWKGGKYRATRGYVYVYSPNHPSSTIQGYVMQHRLVMEQHLGRLLTSEEQVHHINEIKDDNRIENLKLMSGAAEHRVEHGKYESDQCGWCGADILRSEAHRRRWERGFCNRLCSALYGSAKASEKARTLREQ